MSDFTPMLNWTLLRGSHEFPGPDGGTCVNEAAMVASGFAYRRVGHARELPPCFCPVIGAFSIWLNDEIRDTGLRMRLLSPFVTRLAGTRGTPADERARLEAVRARLRERVPERARRRRYVHRHVDHLLLGSWLGSLTVRHFTIGNARDVRELIRIADAVLAAQAAERVPAFFEAMAAALEDMLAVGPRPSVPDVELLRARMEEAKRPRALAAVG